MRLADKNTLLNLAKKYGFHFSKGLGQNFLIDQSVPGRIADGCGVGSETAVLEIGPGVGTLTTELSRRAKKVVAVELDRSLSPVLEEVLRPFPNTRVVWGDILKIDLSALYNEHFLGMDTVLCANLPYYITTPVIMRLLECGLPFRCITVMVQREVARRLCALPCPDYGAVSVAVRYRCDARILFEVPPESFFPAPKVHSAVVRMDLLEKPRVTPFDSRLMFGLVRAAFSQRRKTLQNALHNAYGNAFTKEDIKNALADCRLSPQIRGEALSLEQFSDLSDALIKKYQKTTKN